jgi:peroxiredoxin
MKNLYIMKYQLFLSLCAIVLSVQFSCSIAQENQNEYKIFGIVQNIDTSSNIILAIFDPVTQERISIDTTKMDTEGHYQLEYHFDHPDLFRVNFPERQTIMLAIDEGQVAIELNVVGKSGGAIDIIGSPDSEKLLGYNQFREESNQRLIRPTYTAMREAQISGDGEDEAIAVAAYVENSKLHRKELIDYTTKNIGTSVALYGTVLRWTGDDEVSKLEKLVADFAQSHPDLPMTHAMQDKVNRYKKIAIGVKAPDIHSKDQYGNPIKLFENLGKVTLIDFWASWCGPCIRQLPDLHKAYDAYQDDGFQIFSVSVDTKENKWTEAIEKYQMNWLHASDVNGWQSAHANDYNVTFVPFNLLLDENGTIIGKNLHSVTLQETVKQLLNKS